MADFVRDLTKESERRSFSTHADGLAVWHDPQVLVSADPPLLPQLADPAGGQKVVELVEVGDVIA